MNKEKWLNPSAFIPFCSFGNDLEIMGAKIDGFDDPVCNSFKTKIVKNHLCYEVDLEKFKSDDNIVGQLENGLSLILDYNEDKQIIDRETKNMQNKAGMVHIHLDTISESANIEIKDKSREIKNINFHYFLSINPYFNH